MDRKKNRKFQMLPAVLLCALLVLSGCGESAALAKNPPKTGNETGGSAGRSDLFSAHGKLSVKGTQLVDKNKKPVQLKGISTHGLSWFPQYVDKKGFKTLRDEWGCNVVRLAMYTAEGNGYCTGDEENKKALKKLVNKGVKYATDLDMYVIVDWHILSDGNPNTYKKEAKSYFNYMSKKYKDNDHVIYEICNEPNGGVGWKDVKNYAEEIIKTIRKNDKDAIIIVGSPTWSQDVDLAAKDPLTGKNIMYSLHFYAATHKEGLRQKAQTAIDKGLPLFVTEFGFCDASGNGSIDKKEAAKWMEYLDDNQISYCMWSLCNKAEAASALKPECSKTSGWKNSDLSEAGKLLVKYLGGSVGSKGDAADSGGDDTEDSGTAGGDGDDGADIVRQSAENNGCQVTVTQTNSWADDNNSFFQYSVELKNGDKVTDKSWEIKISFTKAYSVEQGWCGDYEESGKTLTITPLDYNRTLNEGTEISDIGFIVKSTAGNKISKVELVLKNK